MNDADNSSRPLTKKKTLPAFIAALILMFGTPLAATAAQPASDSKDYSSLAANWCTWVVTQPASTNPLFDQTGAQCANQQAGNTWFLGGLFTTSGSVTRSCTIPAHTAVFFPFANYVDVEYASDNGSVKTVRSYSDFVQAGATNLSATVDGRAVSSNAIEFEHSDVFSFSMPNNNVFGAPAGFMYPWERPIRKIFHKWVIKSTTTD